jgi:hypothetical protein
LTDERRTPDPAAKRQRELDAKVEHLAQRIAEVVNTAGPEHRQDLREYAMELLREGTEVADAPPAESGNAKTNAAGSNPIGIALLLGMLALPALLLFPPVGVTLLAIAMVMGVWGVVWTLVRRR